jgi:hypothetical protein
MIRILLIIVLEISHGFFLIFVGVNRVFSHLFLVRLILFLAKSISKETIISFKSNSNYRHLLLVL